MLIVKYGFDLGDDFAWDLTKDLEKCVYWWKEVQQAGHKKLARELVIHFAREKNCEWRNNVLDAQKAQTFFAEWDPDFLQHVVKFFMEDEKNIWIRSENVIMCLVFASKYGLLEPEILKRFLISEFQQHRESVQSTLILNESCKDFIMHNIDQVEQIIIHGDESIECPDDERINDMISFLKKNYSRSGRFQRRGPLDTHFMQITLKLRLLIHKTFDTQNFSDFLSI
jgi:hypothetical protein